MTQFLFTYIKKTQKCNEQDNFQYTDWLTFLDLLTTPAMHLDIEHIEFKPPPNNDKNTTWSLTKVVKKMKLVSQDIELLLEGSDQ